MGLRIVQSEFNSLIKELERHKEVLILLLPEHLREQFKRESYIAGGSIYTMYHEGKFKDVDFFIRTDKLKDDLLKYFKSIDKLKIKLFDSSQMWLGKYKDLDLIITDNAISIGLYQIVLKDIGDPESVVGQFDFLHNMFYIENSKLHRLSPMSALEGNELIYNEARARDIVGTVMRVPKFVSRGMKIKHKEMAKILLKLHNTGFNKLELETLKGKTTSQSFGSGH